MTLVAQSEEVFKSIENVNEASACTNKYVCEEMDALIKFSSSSVVDGKDSPVREMESVGERVNNAVDMNNKSDNKCDILDDDMKENEKESTREKEDVGEIPSLKIKIEVQNVKEFGVEEELESEPTTKLSKVNAARLDSHRIIISQIKRTRRKTVLRPYEPTYNSKGKQTYCVCRKPDDGEMMLQCDTCKEWYHGSCIGVSEEEGPEIDVYICSLCEIFIKDLEQSRAEDKSGTRAINNSIVVATTDNALANKSIKSSSIKCEQPVLLNSPDSSTITTAKPKKVSKHSQEMKTMESLNDKTRQMARKNFMDTISTIFSSAISDLKTSQKTAEEMASSVDIMHPKEYSVQLEQDLFTAWAQIGLNGTLECGQKYKSKYRSIQFNLKDQSNTQLRQKILTGAITTAQLVQFSAEELASEEAQILAEQVRAQSIQQAVKIKADENANKKVEVELLMLNRDATEWSEPIETDSKSDTTQWSKSRGMQVSVSSNESCESKSSAPSPFTPLLRNDSGATVYDPAMDLDAIILRIHGTPDDSKNDQKIIDRVKRDSNDVSTDIEEQRIKKQKIESLFNSEASLFTTDHTASSSIPISEKSSIIKENKLDYVSYLSDNEDTYMPSPHSPPQSPLIEHNSPPVWSGEVSLPLIGKFSGHFNQVSGKVIKSENTWSQIVPRSVSIDGRIPHKDVLNYLDRINHHSSSSKHIVVIQFKPAAGQESEYKNLYEYFESKKRYGVIKTGNASVKDMYIIPVAALQSVPDSFKLLPECHVNRASSTTLYGVIVLHTAILNKLLNTSAPPPPVSFSPHALTSLLDTISTLSQPTQPFLTSQNAANPALEALLKQMSAGQVHAPSTQQTQPAGDPSQLFSQLNSFLGQQKM